MVFIILSEQRWVYMADKLRYCLGFIAKSQTVPANFFNSTNADKLHQTLRNKPAMPGTSYQ